MRRRATSVLLAAALGGSALRAADPDPLDLLRRSIQAEEVNRARASSYLYTEDITRTVVVGEQVVESASQRYEVIYLAGEPYFRLVGRDGKALTRDEEEQERQRMELVAADRRAGRGQFTSPAERPRISVVYRILPESHEIRYLGGEKVGDRQTWVLEAAVKKRSGHGGLNEMETRGMRVKLWIDQETLLRVQQSAIAERKVGRLERGASLSYRYAPQADGIWLVRQIVYRTPDGRSKGLPRYRETDQTYSNYHKFQVESVVTPGSPN